MPGTQEVCGSQRQDIDRLDAHADAARTGDEHRVARSASERRIQRQAKDKRRSRFMDQISLTPARRTHEPAAGSTGSGAARSFGSAAAPWSAAACLISAARQAFKAAAEAAVHQLRQSCPASRRYCSRGAPTACGLGREAVQLSALRQATAPLESDLAPGQRHADPCHPRRVSCTASAPSPEPCVGPWCEP